jgi:hypothetical protein
MYFRFLRFIQILKDEYHHFYTDIEISFEKLRIFLEKGGWIDIYYPLKNKFSFHYQNENELYRIDTAPHHKTLSTYPNHIHFKTEKNVIADYILGLINTPEDQFRLFINWILELK